MTSPNGGRSPRTNYRLIRFGIRLLLVVALVIGGIIFHHRGHGYETVRAVYIIAVVGLLIWRISYRSRGGGGNRRNRGSGPFV